MMPRMPAMLVTRETLLPATSAPSLSLMSPDGRSIVRAGALGVEGDRKTYESDATCTLMSLKGRAMLGTWGQGEAGRGEARHSASRVAMVAARDSSMARKRPGWSGTNDLLRE